METASQVLLPEPHADETDLLAPLTAAEGEQALPQGIDGVGAALDDVARNWVPATERGTELSTKPLGIAVGRARVVAAVRMGGRPVGLPVAAGAQHPGGLALIGVSRYGTGIQDGDLLVSVNGVPATSAGIVVSQVVAAVEAKAPAVSALLWRAGRKLQLTVELPTFRDFVDAPTESGPRVNPAPAPTTKQRSRPGSGRPEAPDKNQDGQPQYGQ